MSPPSYCMFTIAQGDSMYFWRWGFVFPRGISVVCNRSGQLRWVHRDRKHVFRQKKRNFWWRILTSGHAADWDNPHFSRRIQAAARLKERRMFSFLFFQTDISFVFQGHWMPKGSINQKKEDCSSNLKDESDLATNFSRPLSMQS